MNSPTNPLVPGKPGIGHEKQHRECREPGHGIGHAAIILDHAAVQAIVEHADAQEHCAGNEAVRDHLHHGAFHAQRSATAAIGVLEHAETP